MDKVYLFDADSGVAYTTEASSLLELLQKFVRWDMESHNEEEIEEVLALVKTESDASDWFCDHSLTVIPADEVEKF